MMQILRGATLSFTDDPALAGEVNAHTHHEDGAVVIDKDGRIAWIGDYAALPKDYADAPLTDYRGCLIVPGFIDAHLHFPQYRMIAAYGEDLLDWLNRFTFVEEPRYRDPAIAGPAAECFIDELFRHGITGCLAFSSTHPEALEALFTEAERRGMALASGKTMMDRNAPEALTDDPQSGYDESKKLLEKWHGRGRLQYAITPRFAVTSSEAQLEAAGALVKEHPGLIMQTHLSESAGEIEFVAGDFPWAKDYTDVYDRYGLLGENSFFAHGIHLSERELGRLSESGSAIVHCPTSNNFLGSGLFRYRHTREGSRPVKTGIGCDIGGGTGFSMFETMRDAYTVSQLVKGRITAFDAFYLATLGNARLLGMDGEAGTLETGKLADITVLDPSATPIMAARHELSETLHDMLFALMIMGDDRAVRATYVAGAKAKG